MVHERDTDREHLDDIWNGTAWRQVISEHLHACVMEVVVGGNSSQGCCGHSVVVLWSIHRSV